MCMGTTQPGSYLLGRIRFTPMCMGTTLAVLRDVLAERFTPMCMGTTDRGDHPVQDNSVHPHVHGDNVGVAGGE